MPNGLKIEWSEEAIRNLDSILDYLIKNWTEREIVRFVSKLETRLHTISMHPSAYPGSAQHPYVRPSVISKQTSVYYTVLSNRIVVLSLFDTRQHPGKLKL